MTTTDHVLIIVVSALLSIFLLLLITIALAVLKLVSLIRKVTVKAEGVIDTVENAAEVFTDTHGKASALKVIKNLYKISQRKR